MAGPGYNTKPFGIGIYQPISGGTTIGDGFMPVTGPYTSLVLPYSGTYGGTYGFVLNTMMRQPKVHQYIPAPMIGLDNLGVPVVRGFPTIVWTYSSLRTDYWYYLKNLYKLAGLTPLGYQYLVLIQYPDERNPDVNPPLQQLAYWDPPIHAYRDVGAYWGVTLTFSHVGKAQIQPETLIIPATS